MKNLTLELEYFNFSTMEANIYITLLKHGNINGSQISKIIGCSRSAVYDSLRKLQEKGAILQLEGEVKVYTAKQPEMLMEEIKEKSIRNAEKLKEDLKEITEVKSEQEYWNIKGEANFISKLKMMFEDAKEEVYINTNFKLDIIKEEFEKLNQNGVKIVLFSFIREDKPQDFVEYYYNDTKENPCVDLRLMVVVDNRKIMVVNRMDNNEIIGTYTENPLMVNIISEHIHHDIYLTKLDKKYGKNLIDKEIQIGSKFEKFLELKLKK